MRTASEESPPLLPAGFHEMTLADIRALCVGAKRFATSTARSGLMDSLDGLVGRLNRGKIAGELWVDGSFLTEEINPRDVDLSLRVGGPFYDAASARTRKLIDSVEFLRDTERIDGYVQMEWPVGDPSYGLGQQNRDVWEKQWGRSRSGGAKGIAVVKLDREFRP